VALALFAALPAGRARAAAPNASAAAAPGALPAGTTFVIRLARPLKAGDAFAYTADATLVQTMTANLSGQTRTLQPRSISIHFEGTEKILAVGPRGEPTRVSYAVEKCTTREGKQEVVIIQPGRVVTVEAGKWKPLINVDQGGLTIQNEMLLRAVVSVPNEGQAGDDDCFGTKMVQKVGDTWQVPVEGFHRALVAMGGTKVRKQDVSGTVKVAGTETVDGALCLRVQGKMKVEHFLPPGTELPQGSRMEDATFEYKFTRLLPVDNTGPCLADSHSSNVLLKLRTDDAAIGADVLLDGKLLQTVGIKRRPLKR
jgi:hypothetical protein